MNKQAEKRKMIVKIAKDVIKQLDEGKYVPTLERYVMTEYEELPGNTELQTVFKGKFQCDVCAMGALFVSATRLYNSAKVRNYARKDEDGHRFLQFETDGPNTAKLLRKYFSNKQIALIETAYMSDEDEPIISSGGRSYPVPSEGSYEQNYELAEIEFKEAANFGAKYDYDDERLRAIMENIIKNDGVFIPWPERIWT